MYRVLRFIFSTLLLVYPLWVLAEDPSVTIFTAYPTTTRSGDTVDFAWQLQNAGGYSFLIPCSSGIKLKYSNGGAFTCDSRVSSTAVVNDLLRITIGNVSGGAKNITARVIPKSASGQDYDTGAKNITVTVATNPQPIKTFTTSATSTTTGVPVNISWVGEDIGGVNLMVECKSEIKVKSSSYTAGFLPCDTTVFANDLSYTGSLPLEFTNPSTQPTPLKLTLLPAIAPQSYDGTHAKYLDLIIASDVLPDPIVKYFNSTTTIVNSFETLNISWSTEKAVGVNLKISCVGLLTSSSTRNPSLTLPCGDTFAFPNALEASSTLGIIFQNNDRFNAPVTLTLIPSRKAGEYDATRSKNLAITVRPVPQNTTSPPATTPQPTIAPPPASPPASPTPAPPPTSPTLAPPPAVTNQPSKTTKIIFVRLLTVGSRSSDVSALQEFLKRDPTLYPEGLVTGYFGQATLRAVQRFQKKYNIASPGVLGYGLVGPKTRAKLNERQ